jgi:hypothetical protein
MIGSLFAGVFAVCMVLMVFSILSSSGGNVLSAAQWGCGGLIFGYMCVDGLMGFQAFVTNQ